MTIDEAVAILGPADPEARGILADQERARRISDRLAFLDRRMKRTVVNAPVQSASMTRYERRAQGRAARKENADQAERLALAEELERLNARLRAYQARAEAVLQAREGAAGGQ